MRRLRFAAANTPENKDALRRQTEEAASRGLFGAPSFTIGEELFWGNDRLEAALAWVRAPHPKTSYPQVSLLGARQCRI